MFQVVTPNSTENATLNDSKLFKFILMDPYVYD